MADFDITAPDGRKFRVSAPEGATQDEALAYAKEQFAKMPTQAPNPNPGVAGMVKFGAGLAGAPVDAIQSAINIPPQAVKAGLMAAGRYDLANKIPMLEGSFGGSQSIERGLKATGIPALNPENPTPKDEAGTAAYDLAKKGGFIPGGVIPAAASMAAERLIGPEYGAVGSMAPAAAMTAINAARAPRLAEQQAHQQVRDATWREAQEAGYVVPPSRVNSTFLGNRLESVAGKSALDQEAATRNQVVTDNLARRAASLPDGAPITQANLEAARNTLAQPYREIGQLSPMAGQILQRLRDARAESRLQWAHYERQQVPESQRLAQAADQRAENLENMLERLASRQGRPDLVPQLRQARVALARNYQVEDALNVADGHVNAQDIGNALRRNAPLDAELRTIGRFALAFPKDARPSASTPTAGVSALEPNAAAAYGFAGEHMAPGVGWMAGGVPFIRGPVRAGILSAPYQNTFAVPNYQPAMRPEGALQSLLRAAIINKQEGQ